VFPQNASDVAPIAQILPEVAYRLVGLWPTAVTSEVRRLPLATSINMKSLARRGAEARLRELKEEAKQLLNIFPDLGASFDEDELPLNFILRRGARQQASAIPGGSRRKPMSAAQRKAVGERMKKYWAARRKTR
jgi:hypothetical protein